MVKIRPMTHDHSLFRLRVMVPNLRLGDLTSTESGGPPDDFDLLLPDVIRLLV